MIDPHIKDRSVRGEGSAESFLRVGSEGPLLEDGAVARSGRAEGERGTTGLEQRLGEAGMTLRVPQNEHDLLPNPTNPSTRRQVRPAPETLTITSL